MFTRLKGAKPADLPDRRQRAAARFSATAIDGG
jgi:hypothetical protein